ncbi:hypothetical protein ACFE04_001981 [Oxalis oulophora]
MKTLSQTFPSIKVKPPNHHNPSKKPSKPQALSPSPSSKSKSWSVYLILSTNSPIKTYVGVTNNFNHRLKQHNGELKGGAKASRSGRPWVCACLIRGFSDHSEACVFESKWKSVSRKLPRKKKNGDVDEGPLLLLQHREKALDKVKGLLDCSCLEIDWKLNPF